MNEIFFQFQKSDPKVMERFISSLTFNVYFIPVYMCAHTCYIFNIACIWFLLDTTYYLAKYNMTLSFHTLALWLNDGRLKIMRD